MRDARRALAGVHVGGLGGCRQLSDAVPGIDGSGFDKFARDGGLGVA